MNTAGKKNKRISKITKFESDFLKIKEEIAAQRAGVITLGNCMTTYPTHNLTFCVHFRLREGRVDRRSLDHRLSTRPLMRKLFFYSHAIKTHFHKNGFALGPVLEVGVLDLRNVGSSQ